MPGLVLVCHPAAGDHLFAFGATRGELLLVARCAVDFLIFRYKAFGADGRLAESAAETFVVPLFSFVFHFLHARSEYLATAIAASGECLVVTIGAEDTIVLRTERLVHQGDLAHTAQEAVLMPVLLFV